MVDLHFSLFNGDSNQPIGGWPLNSYVVSFRARWGKSTAGFLQKAQPADAQLTLQLLQSSSFRVDAFTPFSFVRVRYQNEAGITLFGGIVADATEQIDRNKKTRLLRVHLRGALALFEQPEFEQALIGDTAIATAELFRLAVGLTSSTDAVRWRPSALPSGAIAATVIGTAPATQWMVHPAEHPLVRGGQLRKAIELIRLSEELEVTYVFEDRGIIIRWPYRPWYSALNAANSAAQYTPYTIGTNVHAARSEPQSRYSQVYTVVRTAPGQPYVQRDYKHHWTSDTISVPARAGAHNVNINVGNQTVTVTDGGGRQLHGTTASQSVSVPLDAQSTGVVYDLIIASSGTRENEYIREIVEHRPWRIVNMSDDASSDYCQIHTDAPNRTLVGSGVSPNQDSFLISPSVHRTGATLHVVNSTDAATSFKVTLSGRGIYDAGDLQEKRTASTAAATYGERTLDLPPSFVGDGLNGTGSGQVAKAKAEFQTLAGRLLDIYSTPFSGGWIYFDAGLNDDNEKYLQGIPPGVVGGNLGPTIGRRHNFSSAAHAEELGFDSSKIHRAVGYQMQYEARTGRLELGVLLEQTAA